jgi:uncharacterized repeat protein (TIGR01451 family)
VNLSLTKTVDDASPGIGQTITFTVTLANGGPAEATNVTVSDVLPAGLAFVAATASSGSSYDANTGVWTVPTLANAATATLDIRATVITAGDKTNTASITHSDQPDPNGEDNQASVTVAALFDPPTGRKVVNAANLPELEWRMVWINSGNNAAINVQVKDPVPLGTTYVATSLVCAPQGVSSTTTCTFDAVHNRIFWQGVIGPDLGATDETSAANEVVITFRVTAPSILPRVINQATALTDTNGDGFFTDETTAVSVSASNPALWTRSGTTAPLLSPAGLGAIVGILMALGAWSLRRGARRI